MRGIDTMHAAHLVISEYFVYNGDKLCRNTCSGPETGNVGPEGGRGHHERLLDFVIKNCVLRNYRGDATEVAIPDGITEIDAGAFQYRKVTRVTIPDSVQRIGMKAFA